MSWTKPPKSASQMTWTDFQKMNWTGLSEDDLQRLADESPEAAPYIAAFVAMRGAREDVSVQFGAEEPNADALPFRIPSSQVGDEDTRRMLLEAGLEFAPANPADSLSWADEVSIFRDRQQAVRWALNPEEFEFAEPESPVAAGAFAGINPAGVELPPEIGGQAVAMEFLRDFIQTDDPALIQRWQRLLWRAGLLTGPSGGDVDWEEVPHGVVDQTTINGMAKALIAARDKQTPVVENLRSLASARKAQGADGDGAPSIQEQAMDYYKRSLIGAYFDTWGQPPPPGYIEAAIAQGVNTHEFTWNERQKPAFEQSQKGQEFRVGLEDSLTSFFGMTSGTGSPQGMSRPTRSTV